MNLGKDVQEEEDSALSRDLKRTVWCFSIGSSKFTVPGLAAVTRNYEDGKSASALSRLGTGPHHQRIGVAWMLNLRC